MDMTGELIVSMMPKISKKKLPSRTSKSKRQHVSTVTPLVSNNVSCIESSPRFEKVVKRSKKHLVREHLIAAGE